MRVNATIIGFAIECHYPEFSASSDCAETPSLLGPKLERNKDVEKITVDTSVSIPF